MISVEKHTDLNIRTWFRQHQKDIVIFLHGSCLYFDDNSGWWDAAMWYGGRYKTFHGDLGVIPSPNYAMLVGAKECIERITRAERVYVVTSTPIMWLNKRGNPKGKNVAQKEAVLQACGDLDVTFLSAIGAGETVNRYIPSLNENTP